MQTIEFSVPDKLAVMFDKVCLENNKLRENILAQLLEDYIQDISDYNKAVEIISSNSKTYSLEEIEAKYGLDN